MLLCQPLLASAQYKSEVWCPDKGDGTYTNPVINADYSDPDVCVGPSGEDYYLTASSFQCIPGLPIHPLSVITTASTISIGVTPTMASSW